MVLGLKTFFKLSEGVNYENIEVGKDFGNFIMENFAILSENFTITLFLYLLSFGFMFIIGMFNKGLFTHTNNFILLSLFPLNVFITIIIVSFRNKE